MTVIYGLIFVAGLLTGGGSGWLITTQRYERLAAEHNQDELEMAEVQEIYTAWAMLRRIRSTSSPRIHSEPPG